jgi:hypothetical protein
MPLSGLIYNVLFFTVIWSVNMTSAHAVKRRNNGYQV